MGFASHAEGLAGSRWAAPALLLVALCLYLPSLTNRFAMDDEPLAESQCVLRPGPDPMISAHFDADGWEYVRKFFLRPYWWPESYNDGLYRPVAVMSYGLVYQSVGRHLAADDEALPQHGVNILLHVWAVWLAFQIVLAVGGSRMVAWLTGLLFAVHAIHSEVVLGIVGRAEIFSFCFGAQAMLLLSRGGWWRLALAGLAAFLAYGSKESSLCWIPFFLCYRWVQLRAGGEADPGPGLWRRRSTWVGLAVLVIPVLLWLWLRSQAMAFDPPLGLPADPSSNPLGHEPMLVRWWTGVKVWGYGLWLCLAPFQLSSIYSPKVFSIVATPFDIGFLAGAVSLLAFLVVGWIRARKAPLLFLAMACFLGFSFVTSNLPLPIGTIFGERLYYTPSLGICLVAALLWPRLRGRGRDGFLLVLTLWCAANVFTVVKRTADWHDSGSLFRRDVQTYPQSIDLHRKAAASYSTPGPEQDLDQAIHHLEKAKLLDPNYVHAYRELGKVYMLQEEWTKAIEQFDRALEVDYPEPPGAETLSLNSIGDCHLHLARAATDAAVRQREAAAAEEWYRKTLAAPAWNDKDGTAYNKLGDVKIFLSTREENAQQRRKLTQEAIELFFKTLALGEDQQVSTTLALRKIFHHAVNPEILLPRETFEALYRRVQAANLQDNELLLLTGAMAYRVKLPSEQVLTPLQMAFRNTPPDQRTPSFYRAHLFYADALREIGRGEQAAAVLRMLLGRPEISEDVKQQIRAQLSSRK